MIVSGIVERTYAKAWEGRNGSTTLHSFQIKGDRRYFRTGEKPSPAEGSSIRFSADDKGNVKDLEYVESAAPKAPTSAPRPAAAKADSREAYWDNKEKRQQEVVEPRITFSSAQSDAVALVTAALQHDILSFGNANKAAKLGLLLDYVDQITERFAAQRWNAHANLGSWGQPSDDTEPEGYESEDASDLG